MCGRVSISSTHTALESLHHGMRLTMHGTLPLSEEQALVWLREGAAPARASVAALAREWGWSRGKVRHRLDRWRKTGDLPPASKRAPTRRNRAATEAPAPAASVSMPVPAPMPATTPCAPRSEERRAGKE